MLNRFEYWSSDVMAVVFTGWVGCSYVSTPLNSSPKNWEFHDKTKQEYLIPLSVSESKSSAGTFTTVWFAAWPLRLTTDRLTSSSGNKTFTTQHSVNHFYSVCQVKLPSGPPELFTFSYCAWLWNWFIERPHCFPDVFESCLTVMSMNCI